jgi:hypothetical protein
LPSKQIYVGSIPTWVIIWRYKMAKNVSKNSRGSNKTQSFKHICGGEIKMKGIFVKKVQWKAVCEKCGEEHAKPSDFELA